MNKYIKTAGKTGLSFLLTCLCAVPFTVVSADEDDSVYYLSGSGEEETAGEYESYREASAAFDEMRDDYENLLLYRDDVLVKAEYAAAVFETDAACEYLVSYRRESDGREGSVNGCYGADALYLDTDDSGENALIMISGMKGYVSLDDIVLIPADRLTTTVSSYTVNEGTLFHQIKTQMDNDLYSSYIRGGSAPEGISEGDVVYSWDGHYFYRDYFVMTDDIREGTRENALNADSPYYDYFQFLSHRSLSSYSSTDFARLINEIYGIRAQMDGFIDRNLDGMDDTLSRSQLYGTENALAGFQNRYGANALLALGLSELESSYGRSYYAFAKNNLFEHAAYDTDSELENNRYNSVVRSLYSHAKYFVSGSHCSPLKDEYQGGFFGNLASGMNASCSADPYWGEKAASLTRQADLFLGGKDLSAYTVGIKTNDGKMQIYRAADKAEGALYNSPASPDYAVIILGEEGDFYRIQSDSTLTDQLTDISYDYEFSSDIGYVLKEDISHVEYGSQEISLPEYRIEFSAGEGMFSDGDSVFAAYYRAGEIPAAEQPECYEAEFAGWDREVSAADEDTSYEAVYRDIDSVEISQLPKQDYEINDRLDLQGALLKIHYADGSEKEIPVTPEMTSGYDLSANGDQAVTVTYCGLSADYGIHVSAEQDARRNDIKTQIEEVIREYGDAEEIDEEAAGRILAVKQSVDDYLLPYLTQDQLRSFDRLVHQASRDRILLMVSENTAGFGISGVSLSLPEKNTGELRICRIEVGEVTEQENTEAVRRAAEGMGYSLCGTVSFRVSENDEPVSLRHPVICSLKKPEGDPEGMVYRVCRIDPDGDITECYTRLSQNRISFMTDTDGDFYIASRLTSNVIDFEDPAETVTFETSDEMPPIEEIHPNFPYGMAALAGLTAVGLFILGRLVYLRFYRKRRRQERIDQEKEAKDLELTTMKLELGDIELWTESRDRKKHDKHNRKSG